MFYYISLKNREDSFMKHKALMIALFTILLPMLAFSADNTHATKPKTPTLTPAQRNLQTIKALYSAINNKNDQKAASFFNSSYTVEFLGKINGHTIDSNMSQSTQDLSKKLAYIDYVFPDHQTHLFNTIAQKNQVFVYTITVAKKTEPFLESGPIDKYMKIVNFNIFQFDDNGKINQVTILWNEPTSMKKLAYMIL